MGKTTAAAERSQTKPFAQFLQEQRRGKLHADLGEALAEVVAGVMKHGKPGALTLKIKVTKESDEHVAVHADYVAAPPTPPADPSMFYADDLGRMSRNRLDQERLPIEAVADPDEHDAAGEAAHA